ncbi:aminoglycoside phosphotransferase family protein [Cycloclasticus sp. P1]|jgi:N-acetylmuramate 1-kinase|uniref:aminoglycoside phosphotransferase family protein n=1 Tax=Cycloclasticus sp. (strain P1) TaxID=385025 RepID=UPI000286A882|nr:phosphotransferase [Cycloclasticus sp. P1]AFT67791.1 Phosphotransferase enzyme family protein [Cycloclasticus sp. P1]
MVRDERKQRLIKWLSGVLLTDDFSCEPASSDASFRRYFRVKCQAQSFVVMDAPPAQEDCTSFIMIAEVLRENGIYAPEIFYKSLEEGFLMLSDLGTDSYLDKLNEMSVNGLYQDAATVLHKMHAIALKELSIPHYDSQLLHKEMGLFDEWFISQLLSVELSSEDKKTLVTVKNALTGSALEQPQVFVHRDYHSRNLMVTQKNNPGVIDFQDAVVGPISYDLVSLYRDCYINWPDEKIYAWLDAFLQQRKQRGCSDDFDSLRFYQWFDWMGVQRHMKAVGIFSRLLLRDGKKGYLKDIPRTLAYITRVCSRYETLKPLADLINKYQLMKRFTTLQQEREEA